MRLSLTFLIIAAVGVGVGFGMWINAGCGIASGSFLLGLIALFYDDGKGRK